MISAHPSHVLTACSVKTTGIVNLHTAADANSAVITVVPNATSLYATARAGDWIQVIYGNTQGWLAVRYLSLDGTCG